jgi:hypothetical protein
MSAVAGVAVAVEGESAESTACDNEESVTIGGRNGGGLIDGLAMLGRSGELFLGDGRRLLARLAFGDGI